MGKEKLAVCIGDENYRERFVQCLMNHYRHRFELHVFRSPEEVCNAQWPVGGLLIGSDYSQAELEPLHKYQDSFLYLQEEEELPWARNVEKYQEVYKIVEAAAGKGESEQFPVAERTSIIGVCSLTAPQLQLPFAVLMTQLMGEEKKVLLLDLQPYSGLRNSCQEEQAGLEDLMVVATTGVYSRSRVMAAIRHEKPWDYVYPVRNSVNLKEGGYEVYHRILEILSQELEYDAIVVNVADGISGGTELLAECSKVYLLHAKTDVGVWRERDFTDEMERQKKDALLHRIDRVEIPAVLGSDWEKTAEQWRWNELGNLIRARIWGEKRG